MQDELEPGSEVQHFAFGGIANPSQSPFLRGSDREYLEARQKELDAFEQQRQAYNTALQEWQTKVYNPYVEQVNAFNAAAQQYNTDVYNPYKAQVDAYNAALEKYNKEVYEPYATQYAEYEKAVNAWNAGDRTSDYAGPAAPTLARNFDMTLPTQPKAFEMTAPTAPADFSMTAPVLPFKEEDVIKYQQEAAARARRDAGNRAVAIDVVSNPDQFNFGSMSVSNRFMAEGGPVSKSRKDLDSLMRLAEGGSTTKEIRDWWAANEGKGTQADLDRWLATSGYTAAQMNEALPQFGVADLNSAIKRAQAQQEVADRQARREALRQQYPGQGIIVSGQGPGAVDSPSAPPAVNRISAVPKREMDTARAQLDAQTANYMDWYLNQMNTMLNKRNIDIVNEQGVNPYADANALRGAQEAMQRAQGRQALGTGYTPEWSDPNWREKQTAREAQQAAENARRAQEAQNSIFTTGPGNRTVIGGSVPAGSAGPARTNAPALIPPAPASVAPVPGLIQMPSANWMNIPVPGMQQPGMQQPGYGLPPLTMVGDIPIRGPAIPPGFAEGGEARKMMNDMDAPEDDAALMRMLDEITSNGKLSKDQVLEAVDRVAAAGRGGDELLAYLSPESVAILKKMGGAGTINPATGLPEFKGGVLGKVGRAVKRLFGRSGRAPAAQAEPGAPTEPVAPTPPPGLPPPPQAEAPKVPSAAELMKQLDEANAARKAAEEKAAADLAALRAQQEAALKAQQEAAVKAQEAAIAAALKADAEARAKAALPMSQAADAISGGKTTTGGTTTSTTTTGGDTVRDTSVRPIVPTVYDPRSVSGMTGGPAGQVSTALMPAANWSASPSYSGATATGVQSYSGPNPLDMTAFLKSMPSANWSGTGSGPRTTDQAAASSTSGGFGQGSNIPYQTATNAGQVGGIGTAINLVGPAMPGIGAFGPVGTASQQSLATRPSNFFAQSQGAYQGMTPGTVSAPYNPMAQYQGPSPLVALAYNPNLSPGMLGGMQNAGMMTDRLGNRIYAPGTPPPGFAKGGQVDLDAMRALVDASNVADEEEGPTVDDYAGEAKRMLASIQPSGQTQKMSRTRLPATGGGAETPKEMGMQADALTTPADYKPKKAKSAQAELRALAKQYALKQRAAENQAKGLMQNTLGAPTLEQPSLTRDSLSIKRFEKGGEAKKAEEVEGEDGPSASKLLRRLGLAVARGVPQAVTGFVDLAALPLTATGRMKAEDVVGTTDYLTKRGLLPPPQEGLASESAELLSSMASPGGATKAALVGMLGPKGIIEAARRSSLFKGKGMTVPEEKFSAQEMLKMLEEQGVDTSRTWLRGKKAVDTNQNAPHYDYGTLEYLYNYQKRPDAIEAAMRDSRRSQASAGRSLSRQSGDRDVTKFNTKGGVWLTESPSLAQTYTGDKGYVIPVYAPKPDAVLDAKGEQWTDFYRKDKGWKEAFADPNVRLVEVRNVIDAGPHWSSMISPEASEEELRALLTATNLFAKKPFDKRVVNKMTGEPYEYKNGGAVKRRA